nr:hypothetical protein [Tanacetum cinerariifolium]
MLDSEDSTVTYTIVSSPYEGRSGDVSPEVDGPPVMPEDPYTYVVAAFQAIPPSDYVPGPEEPKQARPSLVYIPYVPKPVYPEYILPEDDVFPAEEPPLPAAASPTADLPGYIPESDPDEDPEDDDEDPEEDPADHDDEEEEEPSGDDADEEDEEQDEDDDDEEEEYLASADSIQPPPALRVMAKISFRPQPPTLSFTKEDAERFLAMHIPPPSPLTLLSSPLPQIPSPILPALPHILPIPLPAASPPLQLLSSDHRVDRPEVTLPPRKRLSIVHCPGYEAGESSVAVVARPIKGRRTDYRFIDSVEAEIRRQRAEDIGYGIRDTWIDPRDVAEEEALTTLEGVNTRITALAAVQEQETQDIYGVMEDTQGRQTEIFQRVEALVDDSQYHYETSRLLMDAIFSCDLKKMAPKKAAPKGTTRIVGNDAAYVMTWIELKKKMEEKKSALMRKGRLQTRGSLKTLPETTKADSSLLKGKMWQRHTLQDLVIGNIMQGLDLCAPNAISTMMVHVLQDATSATRLATYLVTVGARQMPMLPTIRGNQQSLYDGKVLFEKHDPLVMHDSEETLQLVQESRQKMKQLNKEIKPAIYTKINHLSEVFVSQMAKSREEFYFSNTSKMANVSKPISIPNEEFSDDTTPSVVGKFLNESSSAHQELHKIVKEEIFPIVNQVDARVQNFEIQFLKEAAKFVGDFKSLAKEADESLAKHKALELEIERLLRGVIKRLQAQLGDLKGKSKDTSCVSDTLNPLSQKLENENVELEFQVSDQKDTACGTSENTKFAKQSILKKPPKVGLFRINNFTPSKEEKHVPNKVRASVRTNPITVSQPPVITKKVVNSDSNGLSSIGVDNTKTRRPQPRSNTKNDRVPSTSKSSRSKNKEVELEEHHRKLLLSRNKKHMSSE